MFPNFSMKEQPSLQKQIQIFEERMIVYSNHLQPEDKKGYILIVMVKRRTEVKSHSCFALFFRDKTLCTSGFK